MILLTSVGLKIIQSAYLESPGYHISI